MNSKQATDPVIDWRRVEKSIWQRFRKEPVNQRFVGETMSILKKIVGQLGVQSKSRKALRNIGLGIIASPSCPITILSPICLPVFPGPRAGEVSHLVGKHLEFLKSLELELPLWKLVCLFPPSEKPDKHMDAYIAESYELTKAHYAGTREIKIELLTSYAPGIIQLEESVMQEICNTPHLAALAGRLTVQRSKYYTDLGIPKEFWLRKTRRTMAQYILLGRMAANEGALMCNHSTANIQCYLYAGAGVLHNPVGFK